MLPNADKSNMLGCPEAVFQGPQFSKSAGKLLPGDCMAVESDSRLLGLCVCSHGVLTLGQVALSIRVPSCKEKIRNWSHAGEKRGSTVKASLTVSDTRARTCTPSLSTWRLPSL